jgi:hypothetical protein
MDENVEVFDRNELLKTKALPGEPTRGMSGT